MNEHELAWAMLPEGLEEYFDIEGFEKDNLKFRIILVEKKTIPADLLLEDFPIRGRKGEILFRRRSWKFEGVDRMLVRKIALTFPGTKISLEFADFLKGLD